MNAGAAALVTGKQAIARQPEIEAAAPAFF